MNQSLLSSGGVHLMDVMVCIIGLHFLYLKPINYKLARPFFDGSEGAIVMSHFKVYLVESFVAF